MKPLMGQAKGLGDTITQTFIYPRADSEPRCEIASMCVFQFSSDNRHLKHYHYFIVEETGLERIKSHLSVWHTKTTFLIATLECFTLPGI